MSADDAVSRVPVAVVIGAFRPEFELKPVPGRLAVRISATICTRDSQGGQPRGSREARRPLAASARSRAVRLGNDSPAAAGLRSAQITQGPA
jgi:hypothetical protein